MLTKEDAGAKLGIPPAMKDRFAVRILKATFGPSKSSGDPMITLSELELAGVPNATGSLDTTVKRGDVTYKVAGLKLNPVYFPLTKKSLGRYIDFYEKVNGVGSFTGVDENNPDMAYLDDLVMEAIVSSSSEPERKVLTEEEKRAKVLAGEQPVGDPIKGADGKEITKDQIYVATWLQKYTGDLAPY
jgi:hypothetical protein